MGVFPMGRSRHDRTIEWYDPDVRGVFLFDRFHVPKRLQQKIKKNPYRITMNKCFRRVIESCADARPETWINDGIIDLYAQLHNMGFAQSVEAWQGDALVGGVYGVSIGRAFFGESMFSTKTDASKIALVYLMARLWRQGYLFCDAQFYNPHLAQFGIVEMPQKEYKQMLAKAVVSPALFNKIYSAVGGLPGSDSGFESEAGAASSGASVSSSAAGTVSFTGGVPSGSFSDENDCSGDDVASFLQSITHTS